MVAGTMQLNTGPQPSQARTSWLCLNCWVSLVCGVWIWNPSKGKLCWYVSLPSPGASSDNICRGRAETKARAALKASAIFLSRSQEGLASSRSLSISFQSWVGPRALPARQCCRGASWPTPLSLESFDFHFSLDFTSRVGCSAHLVSILFIRSLNFK